MLHSLFPSIYSHASKPPLFEPGVLDPGCGSGLYSRLFLKGMKVTGIDLSRKSVDYALAQAEKVRLNIDYVCADSFFSTSDMREFLIPFFRSTEKYAFFPMKRETCSWALSTGRLKTVEFSALMYPQECYA